MPDHGGGEDQDASERERHRAGIRSRDCWQLDPIQQQHESQGTPMRVTKFTSELPAVEDTNDTTRDNAEASAERAWRYRAYQARSHSQAGQELVLKLRGRSVQTQGQRLHIPSNNLMRFRVLYGSRALGKCWLDHVEHGRLRESQVMAAAFCVKAQLSSWFDSARTCGRDQRWRGSCALTRR